MTEEHKIRKKREQSITESPLFIGTIALVTLLVLFNMWQIAQLSAISGMRTGTLSAGGSGTISFGEIGEGSVLAPVLLSPGESAAIPGYATKVKELPTISSSPSKPKLTGDAAQDAINALIPVGTPQYGQSAGVTFDDPITSQNVWSRYERSISLTPEQESRWQNLVGKFTCDYCCGSPSNPTIITRCGCAHARAWRGMAKWFIVNMPEATDEQIFGEMSKWKALWYPGPTIKRVLQEQASGSSGHGTVSNLDSLPGMVGGC